MESQQIARNVWDTLGVRDAPCRIPKSMRPGLTTPAEGQTQRHSVHFGLTSRHDQGLCC